MALLRWNRLLYKSKCLFCRKYLKGPEGRGLVGRVDIDVRETI